MYCRYSLLPLRGRRVVLHEYDDTAQNLHNVKRGIAGKHKQGVSERGYLPVRCDVLKNYVQVFLHARVPSVWVVVRTHTKSNNPMHHMQMLADPPLNSVYFRPPAMMIWVPPTECARLVIYLLSIDSSSLFCSDLVIILLDLGYIVIRRGTCVRDKSANIPLITGVIVWQRRLRRRRHHPSVRIGLRDLLCIHFASGQAMTRASLIVDRKFSSLQLILGPLRLPTLVSRVVRNLAIRVYA